MRLDDFANGAGVWVKVVEVPAEPVGAALVSLAILAFGLIAAGIALSRARGAGGQERDDSRQSLTDRGSFVPTQIGRFSAAPLWFWTGEPGVDRVFRPAGSPGKSGGGRPQNYMDRAVVVFGFGEMVGFHAITNDEDVIWEGDLSPEIHPSGTAIETRIGCLRIYWGSLFIDGDLDPILVERLDLPSQLPLVAFGVWDRIDNGQQARFATLNYETTFGCPVQVLPGVPYTVMTDEGHVGVNPAYDIFALVTAGLGLGADLDPDMVDMTSLIELGVRCHDEQLPVNRRRNSGETAGEALQRLLDDIGYTVDDRTGRMVFVPLRPETQVAFLEPGSVVSGAAERRALNRGGVARPQVFTFTDAANGFVEQPIRLSQDGVLRAGAEDEQETTVWNFTDAPSAARVAERAGRLGLSSPDPGTVTLGRDAVHLLPGDRVVLPGDVLTRRVTSVDQRPDGLTVQVRTVLDAFGLEGGALPVVEVGPVSEPLLVAHDLAVAARISRAAEVEGFTVLNVFAIRAHAMIVARGVLVSTDGGNSFPRIGSQDVSASGGLLTGDMSGPLPDWPASTVPGGGTRITLRDADGNDLGFDAVPSVIDTTSTRPDGMGGTEMADGTTGAAEPEWPVEMGVGTQVEDNWVTWSIVAPQAPLFEPLNDDMGWQTLGLNDPAWLTGRQLALIGEELTYVRQVAVAPVLPFAEGETLAVGDDRLVEGLFNRRIVAVAVTGPTGPLPETVPDEVGATFDAGGVMFEVRRQRFEMVDLVRGREDTLRTAWPAGTVVFIAQQGDLTPITDGAITGDGAGLTVRTQPAVPNGETAPEGGAVGVGVS